MIHFKESRPALIITKNGVTLTIKMTIYIYILNDCTIAKIKQTNKKIPNSAAKPSSKKIKHALIQRRKPHQPKEKAKNTKKKLAASDRYTHTYIVSKPKCKKLENLMRLFKFFFQKEKGRGALHL